jgi:lipopolysaccharide export system permease protein
MTRIDRYIMRQVAIVTIFATVILCVAVMLVQSVRLVDMIVNRGLPIGEFAYMATLLVPRFLALIMPIALFGAVLFTYNRMINDSELVVMRSAGLSTAALAKPGILVSIGGAVVCVAMTLYFMPLAAQEMRFHVEKNRSQWGAALLHEGRFTTVGDSITLFVKEREGSELFGLFYHNNEDPDAPYTIMAERGAVVETDDGPRILVLRGSRQSFQDGTLHHVEFDRTSIDIGGSSGAVRATWIQPEERFLPELLWPDLDDRNDRYYRDHLVVEGHNRLASPLLPIAYSAIALAFVLRGGFSRRGNLMSIAGAVAGMSLVLVGHMSAVSIATGNPDLIPLIYANAILPMLLAVAAILRAPAYRQARWPSAAEAAAE